MSLSSHHVDIKAVMDAMDSYNPEVHFFLNLEYGRVELAFVGEDAGEGNPAVVLKIPSRRTAPRGRPRAANREKLLQRAVDWLRSRGVEPVYEFWDESLNPEGPVRGPHRPPPAARARARPAPQPRRQQPAARVRAPAQRHDPRGRRSR